MDVDVVVIAEERTRRPCELPSARVARDCHRGRKEWLRPLRRGEHGGVAGPARTLSKREGLVFVVTYACECVHPPSLAHSDLGQQMRGGAKSEKTQRTGGTGLGQCAPSNEAGTEQRGGGDRRIHRYQQNTEGRPGNDVGSKAARPSVAGKFRRVAEIFQPGQAVSTGPARAP